MSMKDQLKILQDTLKDWVVEEQKRVTAETEFLTDLKAAEALAPVSDTIGLLEAEIELDLAALLEEGA